MAQKQEDKSQPKTTTNSAVQARPKASAQIVTAAAAFRAQSSKTSFVSLHVQLPPFARVPRSQLLHSAHVVVQLPCRPALRSARPHHPLRGKGEMSSDEYDLSLLCSLYTPYTRERRERSYQALAEARVARPRAGRFRLGNTAAHGRGPGLRAHNSVAVRLSLDYECPLRPSVFGRALPATLRTARDRCAKSFFTMIYSTAKDVEIQQCSYNSMYWLTTSCYL